MSPKTSPAALLRWANIARGEADTAHAAQVRWLDLMTAAGFSISERLGYLESEVKRLTDDNRAVRGELCEALLALDANTDHPEVVSALAKLKAEVREVGKRARDADKMRAVIESQEQIITDLRAQLATRDQHIKHLTKRLGRS
jgi:predicted RNase H-like nuclease (RuvC/YqgF family)